MIIFDLDGTLADCSHRRHFIQNPYGENDPGIDRCDCSDSDCICEKWAKWKPDWTAFYEACDQDLPIMPTIQMLHIFVSQRIEIEIWSGRSDIVKQKTIDWIVKHIFKGNDLILPKIRMRPHGDYTPDEQLKEKWLEATYEEYKWGRRTPIECVFDDRPKVLRMWQSHGIFTFDVGQGIGEF